MTMHAIHTREGRTKINWDVGLITFRKPRNVKAHEILSRFRYANIKYDGNRCLAAKDLSGTLHVWTTRPTNLMLEYPDHLVWKRLGDLNLGQFADGELYVPGSGAEAVKTALANGSDTLRFATFGLSWLPDDATIFEMQEESKRTHWDLAETYPIPCNGQLPRLPNCDGLVYKTGMYGDWVKHKWQRTLDCIITGIKPGQGKYTGQCGALVCCIDDIEIANVSGMDDATRKMISTNDIGRVIEVEYERVGSKGRLRHPRFLRYRDDKLPSHCDLAQDQALKDYYETERVTR